MVFRSISIAGKWRVLFWRMGALVALLEGLCAAAETVANPPGSISARFAAAVALEEQELFDLAVSEWRAILAAHPGEKLAARAQYHLGRCLFEQQDLPAARSAFQAAAKARDEELRSAALVNWGIVDFTAAANAKGDDAKRLLKTALDSLDKSLKTIPPGPAQAEAQLFRGEVLAAQQQWAEAARAFQQALHTKDFSDADRAQDRAAFCYFQQKEYANATASYLELLKRFPQSAYADEARLAAGKCCLLMGDLTGAESLLTTALKTATGDKSAEAAHWLAQTHVRKKEWQRAREIADRALGKNPPPAWRAELEFDRAEALAGEGANPRAAAQAYAALAQAHPQHSSAAWALAEAARLTLAAGDAAAALKLAETHVSASLEVITSLAEIAHASRYQLAAERYAKQDFRGALQLLDQQQTNPTADQQLLIALCEAGQENWKPAAEQLARFATDHPQDPRLDRCLYELAWAHTKLGAEREALQSYERLTQLAPQSALAGEAWCRLGEARLVADQPTEALAALRQAGAAQNSPPAVRERAWHLTAWHELAAKNYAAARKAVEEQLRLSPNGEFQRDAQLMRAECAFAEGDYAGALEFYGDLARNPSSRKQWQPLLLLHQGQALAQQKKWEQSAQVLSASREQHADAPHRAELLYEYGWALQNLGRAEAAAGVYRELAAGPASPLAARGQFMLGEMQFAAKDYDEAVRSFFAVAYGYGGQQASSEYHPWQAESLFEAARCLEQLGKPSAAAKLYQECVERFPKSPKTKHAERWLRSHAAR